MPNNIWLASPCQALNRILSNGNGFARVAPRYGCEFGDQASTREDKKMAAKFKVGDEVAVPRMMAGVQAWWVGKRATVRAVLEDGMYEVLFHDGQDFAFIDENNLAPLSQPSSSSSSAPASGS
jgi:hypothetical protein